MAVQKFVTYNVFNLEGQLLTDEQKLELTVLEESGNYLLHKDILRHQNNQRQGTVSTKTRSEVRGGGRKPWKQKGTGRARAGSNRSPLWKGGGVTFGPKPKQFSIKLNQKERKLALQTLLYNKRKNISIIENLETSSIQSKTNAFCQLCQKCGIDTNQKLLVVVSKKTPELKLATQNIKNLELILATNLNTFSLLKAKQILLTPLAISDIKEMYCG
jgi:large subunit ribosomal protein L4|uniref:ribosomal protein L4 n=1 Tax=Tenuicylindrus belgicus TaxID=1398096 RepID=UPI00223808F2|nr:ribosomal protein L4 [Tenuicylindrus belgicus]UYC31523.1 ribosomal protein L4 [Tenuicylindrus belgicus]